MGFFAEKSMKNATIQVSPDISHEILLDTIPHLHEHFMFDGMIYIVHDIIWKENNKIWKPTIVIHSTPYLKEGKQ